MEPRLPIARNLSSRSGRRLIFRMPAWLGEPRARDHSLSPIVVKPGFSGLEACRDRMPCRVKMLRSMLARRVVAASDVPAFCAAAEVQPPTPCSQALRAARAARRHIGIDSMMISFHGQFLFESILYGSSNTLPALPFANVACASAAFRRGNLLPIGIVTFPARTASTMYSKFFVSCLDTKATVRT